MARTGERVAHLHLGGGFDVRDHIANVASDEFFPGKKFRLLGFEDADFFDLVVGIRRHELHGVAGLDRALDDANVNHHAAVGVEVRVESERLQSVVLLAGGVGDTLHDRLENILNANACLRAGEDRLLGGNREYVLELLLRHFDIGIRQIDLVDDRDELEALLFGEVDIRHGLGLHALSGIDDQERAFAGRERAGDLVGKIDMAGCVGEVEFVAGPVFRRVFHGDRVGFDRDPALALEVHGVEELFLRLALLDRFRGLQQTVGERGLAVVDVGDDAEVARVLYGHEKPGNIGERR